MIERELVMSTVTFVEELPEGTANIGGNRKYSEVAQALRDNPGLWGQFAVTHNAGNAAGMIQRYRRGSAGFKPEGEYEFAWRRLNDEEFAIYGRYVG